MRVGKYDIVLINRVDFTLKASHILLDFQYLKVLLLFLIFAIGLFLLDEVEDSDDSILFFIDIADNLAMMDVLILRDWRETCTDFLVFYAITSFFMTYI